MGSRAETLVVQESLPQERLDTYLRSRFAMVSRGHLQRLLEEGHILVNGQPAKATQHPKKGDIVEVTWPEPKTGAAQPEEMPLQLLFEDDELLVLNKEPGVVVHPSAGHEEHTLVNALLHHCQGRLSGIGGVARPGIVHRLDKDTSGCLLVAKTDQAHLSLSNQFAERSIGKVYQALLCGEIPKEKGEIRAAIGRHANHRKRMAVTEGDGREAWTSYRLVERMRASTRVEASLHTGRTHQIRVHFQHLGFPLVGDDVYGKRHNARLKEQTGYAAPRQMLHAWKLSFKHPVSGSTIAMEAPIPPDFQKALDLLRVRAD